MWSRPKNQGYDGYVLASKTELLCVPEDNEGTEDDDRHKFAAQSSLPDSAPDSVERRASLPDSVPNSVERRASLPDSVPDSVERSFERRTTRSCGSRSQHMPLTNKRKRDAKIGAAKVFYVMEMEETANIETSSVYGSAFVMPQLARSAGWPAQMFILAGGSIFYLVLNIVLQWSLVYSLLKEQRVMNKFGGQMYLCDFGAVKIGCPDAPGCTGPDGTKMTPARTYDFKQWHVQKFVRESFKTMFPERAQDIEDNIDPGEYGSESALCRHICAFVFMMAVAGDFFQCISTIRLLWLIPNADDTWLMLYEEDESSSIEDEVHVQIRGMPLHWKILYVILIIIPKYILWQFTTEAGMTFLLETATITDSIVNCTALAFILSLDELLFMTMSCDATKFFMGKVAGYPVHIAEDSTEIGDEDENVMHRTSSRSRMESFLSEDDETILKQSDINKCWVSRSFVWKAPAMVLLWFLFECRYYLAHCTQSHDGSWVSVPVSTPLSSEYSIFQALLPWEKVAHVEKPFWSMPEEKEKDAL